MKITNMNNDLKKI